MSIYKVIARPADTSRIPYAVDGQMRAVTASDGKFISVLNRFMNDAGGVPKPGAQAVSPQSANTFDPTAYRFISPTGNREEEVYMQMAYEYYSKFIDAKIDFSRSAAENMEIFKSQLAEMAADTDYSQMSDAEKYLDIHDRYVKLFGENFFGANPPFYYSGYDPDFIYPKIIEQYYNDLTAAIGGGGKITQAIRTALYGDKNSLEIITEIAAKYPHGAKMTYNDYYDMIGEMAQVGVDGNLASGGLPLPPVLSEMSGLKYALSMKNILDMRLDLTCLCNIYNDMQRDGKAGLNAQMILKEVFNMNINNKGVASTPDGYIDIKWDEIINQMWENHKWGIDEEEEEDLYARLNRWRINRFIQKNEPA